MSFSGTSTSASVFQGAAEAPSEVGARVAKDEEVVSRPAMVRDLSHLAVNTGPAAQAEARARDTQRTHLMSTLKERTAGILGPSPLWADLEALDQVSTLIFLIPCSFLGRTWP